jgi:polysaccharide biosynthesis/export protein
MDRTTVPFARESSSFQRQKRLGNSMKWQPCTLLSILLLPAFYSASSQQAAGKPVLSADPEPPAAIVVTPTGPGPASADPSYIIGPEDSIQIVVWKNADFPATTVPVRPDGMITLPLLGDVPASGRTPLQLAADLTVQLKKLYTDPTVTVSVLAVNSKRIYFFGSVGRPGPLPLSPGMTILQAISSAGGLTDFANKKHIYILRGEPGKQQKIFFDYTKAIKSGNMQGVTLQPGDSIVVP